MSGKPFMPEQIISKLREAEVLLARGTKMARICRKVGITERLGSAGARSTAAFVVTR